MTKRVVAGVIASLVTIVIFTFVLRGSLEGLAVQREWMEKVSAQAMGGKIDGSSDVQVRVERPQHGAQAMKLDIQKHEKGSHVSFSYRIPMWVMWLEDVLTRGVAVVVWPVVETESWWGIHRASIPWTWELWASWLVVGLGAVALRWHDLRARVPNPFHQGWWAAGIAAAPLLALPVFERFKPQGDLWSCEECGKKKLISIHRCQFCGTEASGV